MSLSQLADYLSGTWENREQALDQPAWYVHLRLWHQPLPFLIDGCFALFAEQAPKVNLNQPYRQRVMILRSTASPQEWQVEYRQLKDPGRFQGAGSHPTQLDALSPSDLIPLPGCLLTVRQQQQTFIAQPPKDTICTFEYQGTTRQVVLGFEVTLNQFKSYDRGVDRETGQSLWGAILGPYIFQKVL